MRTLLCFLAVLMPVSLLADEPIGPGLAGPALKQHLRTAFRPATILSYRDARQHMFSTIDDLDGDNNLTCVYTGTAFHAAGIPDHTVVNCEHTWPQSRFQGAGMKSDLHHLYPTFSVINSTRGNKPFADIPDNRTDDWCGPGNTRNRQQLDADIDEYSESDATHFEPREY